MGLSSLTLSAGSARPGREQSEALHLLQELQLARKPLGVRARELGGRCASLLLDVLPDESCVLLDELVPAERAAAVQPGLALHVESSLDGIAISFECQVLTIESDHKGVFYRVSLPNRVARRQRRQSHRVSTAGRRLNAVLQAVDGTSVSGEVVDISADGLAVRLPVSEAAVLGDVRSELDCHLLISDEETLEVQFGICRIIELGGRRHVVIAGRVLNPTPPISRRMGKLVADFERDLARTRPRGHGSR